MNHMKVLRDIKEEFLEKEICKKIKSKKADNEHNDESYKVVLANPTVYIGSLPINTNSDEMKEIVPAFILSLNKTSREYQISTVNIRIIVNIWSPGRYGKEVYQAINDPSKLGGKTFVRDDTKTEYSRDDSGYVELWNIIDVIVNRLQSNNIIAGYEVDHSSVEYDQYRDSEGYPLDFYPYYLGYIDFSIKHTDLKIPEDIKEML